MNPDVPGMSYVIDRQQGANYGGRVENKKTRYPILLFAISEKLEGVSRTLAESPSSL
jgi:hypothetical protein